MSSIPEPVTTSPVSVQFNFYNTTIQSLYAGDADKWTRSEKTVIPRTPEEHAPTGSMGFSRIDIPQTAG